MCTLGFNIPAFVHHAAHYDFDCIWLDLEHRLINEQEVETLLVHCHLADIDCMVRPATLEKTRLYRYLEDGATGLMIPHVSTRERARALVEAAKFPPLGDRGLDGAGLDANYFLGDTNEYLSDANRETFLVVQIETEEAVKNVEAIASLEGIDCLFVGPGDLGMRLRLWESRLSLDDAMAKVAAAAKKYDKAWGCPVFTVEQMQQLHEQGARFLAHGGDYMALKDMLAEAACHYDEVYGAKS